MRVREFATFFRFYVWRIAFVSLLGLVPCFWHKRIEAGDLPSHTYNAWLAHLALLGQAPGVYLDSRWNNILFDFALEKLTAAFGYAAGERVLVVFCVLIFFWGAFALIAAANLRAPWVLVPAILMVTYGWTFYSGFMNFYLAIGLGFFAAALAWRGSRTDFAVAGVLAFVAFLAHPFGFAAVLGMAIYLRLAEILTGALRWALFAAALLIVWAFRYYAVHLRSEYFHTKDFYEMNGADQLVLFRAHYEYLAYAVVAFGMICFLAGTLPEWKSDSERWRFRAPLELWIVLLLAAAVIPEVIFFPQYPGPFALIISRLTCVTAILGLCVLSSIRPKIWHLLGWSACAALFFVWTYQDTGKLNNMESQAETFASSLPYGRRVVETIHDSEESRLGFINHMVDRACIGKCFTFSDYEPSTLQFRIRVVPGSPVVTDSMWESGNMEDGCYVVKAQDLPMNEIYQCDEKDLSKLCMRELTAGEENGRLGYRPDPYR